MKYTENQIYTIKLNSGEEIITRIAGFDNGFIVVQTPLTLASSPQGMTLMPSLFTGDDDSEIRLNISSVSLYCLTEDAVKMKYIEATTGIQVPEKKLILG